jgi:hypothetical protein
MPKIKSHGGKRKGAGRPTGTGKGRTKDRQIHLRATGALREALDAAVAASGLTLAEEVASRLEQSLRHDQEKEERGHLVALTAAAKELAMMLEGAPDALEMAPAQVGDKAIPAPKPGGPWTTDPVTLERLVGGLPVLLDWLARPSGPDKRTLSPEEMQTARDEGASAAGQLIAVMQMFQRLPGQRKNQWPPTRGRRGKTIYQMPIGPRLNDIILWHANKEQI